MKADTSASSWWPIAASSGVLSLALLGDALLYAVLPVYASTFGIGLAWVGVLLSANRFVRVFAYGLIGRLTEWAGPRRVTLYAAIGAVVSTALYGLGEGEWLLLFARVLWGLVYAALVLTTLSYATRERSSAGLRIGSSRTIQRLGPILSLLIGTWAATVIVPREVFVWLAAFGLLAIPLAYYLPRDKPADHPARTPALGRPTALDVLFFLQGGGVDGVFALSITLILAEQQGIATAVMGGGVLLALRHVGEAVAAPIFGALADRVGAARVFGIAVALTAVGFFAVAIDWTVIGALLLLFFRGALAALGPAAIVQATADDAPVVGKLARMQAWRDFGAAVGPIVTGFALSWVSAQLLHLCVGILIVAGLGLWHRQYRLAREEQS